MTRPPIEQLTCFEMDDGRVHCSIDEVHRPLHRGTVKNRQTFVTDHVEVEGGRTLCTDDEHLVVIGDTIEYDNDERVHIT